MVEQSLLIILFLLLTFALGTLDRLKEICDFDGWFKRSIFSKIENQFWFKWFQSHAVNKHKFIYPLRWLGWFERFDFKFTKSKTFAKIRDSRFANHPVFYDGYHNFKNISVAILISYMGWQFGWFFIMTGFFVWYVSQKFTYEMLVSEYEIPVSEYEIPVSEPESTPET